MAACSTSKEGCLYGTLKPGLSLVIVIISLFNLLIKRFDALIGSIFIEKVNAGVCAYLHNLAVPVSAC